jgi:hypothetical protein
MVQVFATRVWGAGLERWPLVTFGKRGYRDSLLSKAKSGALICLVATKGSRVKEEDRGKLLAICEFGRQPVDAETVLLEVRKQYVLNADNYHKDGSFRWPFALPVLRAWKFDKPQDIKSVIGRQLKQSATPGAELFNPEEASRVLALARTPVQLPSINILDALSYNGEEHRTKLSTGENLGKPTLGSIPSIGGYYVTLEKKTAFLYVFRFEDTDIFKVGWSFDVNQRLEDINRHIPTEYLQMRWKISQAKRMNDQFHAYMAEQEFLTKYVLPYRTEGELIKVDPDKLRLIWGEFSKSNRDSSCNHRMDVA